MQRYDIDESKGYPIPVIVPDDLGDYYIAEEADAEIAALKDQIENLTVCRDHWRTSYYALTQRVKELEEQRDAFERLVKVTKEVDRDEPK